MVIKSLEPIWKEKKEKGFTTRNDFIRLESGALFIDRSAIKPCVMNHDVLFGPIQYYCIHVLDLKLRWPVS